MLNFEKLPKAMILDCLIEDVVKSIQWSYPLMEISFWKIPSCKCGKMSGKVFVWTTCEKIDLLLQTTRLDDIRIMQIIKDRTGKMGVPVALELSVT